MHIALVCPDMTGHLNPMTTLGRALAARGHRVTLFGLPPAERYASGLGFVAIGAEGYERNILPGRARLATLTGVRALLLTGRLLHQVEVLNLQELPDKFTRANIDAVITDQVSPSGASVAAAMKLPVALACNALNVRQEACVPPAILGWKYRSGPLGRLRNRVGNRLLSVAAGPIRRSINAWRRRHGLPGFSGANLSATEAVLEIAQQPAFFDFPRRDLPPTFHYTGPWHLPGRD